MVRPVDRSQRVSWGVAFDESCMRGCGVAETLDHVFLDCQYYSSVARSICTREGLEFSTQSLLTHR